MVHSKNQILFCLRCLNIPTIRIIPSKVIKVTISCKCSIRTQVIDEYLFQVYHLNKIIRQHRINCHNTLFHCDKKAKGFCINCQQYLCKQCIKSHKKVTINHHIILPFELNLFHHKKKHENNHIRYCFNCFQTFCELCDDLQTHQLHYTINVLSIRKGNPNDISKSFFNIKKHYKQLLMSVIQKIDLSEKVNKKIKILCKKCIENNKKIINLIKIIISNFQNISVLDYSLYSNFYNNTIFTINNGQFNNLLNLIHRNDYLQFYSGFAIIKQNKDIEKIEVSQKDENNILRFGWRPQICCIIQIQIDNSLFALGDIKGNIIIISINIREFYVNKAHSSIVYHLMLVGKDILLSSSNENIKMWKINNFHLELIEQFNITNCFCFVMLKCQRIAGISLNGKLSIWSLSSKIYFESFQSPESDYIFPMIYYYRKNNTILQLLDGTLSFFRLNPLRLEDSHIKDIHINSKSSFAETNTGRIIICGYYHSAKTPSIMILNMNTKSIELIYHDYDMMYNFDNGKGKSFFILLNKKKSCLIITPKTCLIEIDKTSLRIKKHIPVLSVLSEYSLCSQLSKNEYIAIISSNRFLISKLK